MYLGIDIGTSAVKALIIDDTGQIHAQSHEPLTISRPQSLWSEQDPAQWWQATQTAIGRLEPSLRRAIRAIGLSGQMHGATLIDIHDRPLRPAILWNDARSDAQCRELTRRAPSLHVIAGNLAMPGFTAPKLMWVAEHEPDVFRRVSTVLLPKDYLRLQLTGEKVSDLSDASGTLWLDVARRQWSRELIEATGLRVEQMPTLVHGNAISGQLRPEVAQRWGTGPCVIVAGGAGDNAASAVSVGAVAAGNGFLSLGTSGVIFIVDEEFRPNPESAVHAFCHTLPHRWHRMSVMLSAASCLSWVTRLLGARNEAALIEQIASICEGALEKAPIFLPYMSGERTPHNDPRAQGLFFGLTHDVDGALLGYSVLEGVAFGLADGWAALDTPAVSALSLVGGGSRSTYWAQLIADVLDVPLETHAAGEAGAALGAARLAQLACGVPEDEVCRKPLTTGQFQPRNARRGLLLERQARYRDCFPIVLSKRRPRSAAQR